MTNLRRYVRWQTDFEAKVKLEGALDFVGCTIKDLNFQGGQIITGLYFPRDSFFKLTLVFPDETVLNVEAWVAWQKTIDEYYVYGVYFFRIKDADKEKIYCFLRNNCRQEFTKRWWDTAFEEEEGRPMEDRRVFQRFVVKLPVNFLNLDNSKEGTALTRDICAKGIGIITQENLSVRIPLEIWIGLGDKKEPVYARGEVAWSKPCSQKEYEIGINLEKADLMNLSRVFSYTHSEG
ncbi:MAG: PilZ domain-containing protein [Candidatus Omnitrophota bacterium]|nr:PilZ domain-containing protein [Candidatus Omnitrophota bacterium]